MKVSLSSLLKLSKNRSTQILLLSQIILALGGIAILLGRYGFAERIFQLAFWALLLSGVLYIRELLSLKR